MALSAELLARLPEKLHKNGMLRLADGMWTGKQHALPGDEVVINWQTRLLQGELVQGGVVELCVEGGAALGTSMALRACARAQAEGRAQSEAPWCAFVDPSASLYAPGVQAAGVELRRLFVVRPDQESMSRVALRLVESQVFPVVVVDLKGLPGSCQQSHLGSWVRVVRRISQAVEGSAHTVVLLTDKNAHRPLPLPVAQRIELSRQSPQELQIFVAKNSRGGAGNRETIHWTRSVAFPSAKVDQQRMTHVG